MSFVFHDSVNSVGSVGAALLASLKFSICKCFTEGLAKFQKGENVKKDEIKYKGGMGPLLPLMLGTYNPHFFYSF